MRVEEKNHLKELQLHLNRNPGEDERLSEEAAELAKTLDVNYK